MRTVSCFGFLNVALAFSTLSASDAPSRRLRPVPFTEVKVRDGFWAPRLETNRRVTVPHNISTCEETGRIANFAKAAGLEPGAFEGIYFNDSDVYKMLEGASYTLALAKDPALDRKLDEIIAKIAAAQWPDGYLNTYYTLVEKGKRWTDLPAMHELYCSGHLFEAAVAHWRATGKRSLLEVACRLADHIDRVFGPGKKHGVPGHEEIELALVKLYEATGEERYLRLSEYFIDERGRATERKSYGEYCQDHLPVRRQSDIVGHAVRAMYLYSGVADVAAYTADAELIAAMERVWDNVVRKKMYVTGGIGPSAHNEGFTIDYDLPNASAYAETCASIGMALWNHRLFLLHAEGRFTDVFEQVLFNGLLSGVALDGANFFYVNPLESRGQHHRQAWFGCACCPTNVVRFLPSIGGYFYASSDDGIWVNLYATSEARVPWGRPGAEKYVRIVEESNYPWSGVAKLTIEPEDAPAEFTLHLRIPGWCRGFRLSGGDADSPRELGTAVSSGYLHSTRTWAKGDTLTLTLEMPVERLETHPAVKGNHGRVALRRGPLVYCLEAVDNGGSVLDLAIPRDASFELDARPELLGGAVRLLTRGRRADLGDWQGSLYREVQAAATVPVVAVPYCLWDNRAPGEMVVWIPESTALARAKPVPTLATRAKATASHTCERDTVLAVQDRILPEGSGDGGIPRFTWWPHKGGAEWIQYEFPEAVQVSGVEVYWFDDAGGCRLPESWTLLADDGAGWKPVEGAAPPGVEANRFNVLSFSPRQVKGLRIEAKLRPDASGGILEWQIASPGPTK